VPPDILLSKHGRPGRFHPNPERRPRVKCCAGVSRSAARREIVPEATGCLSRRRWGSENLRALYAASGPCTTCIALGQRPLQRHPSEQRHRLRHAEGHARRASAGDSGRPGSEIRGGEGTAEEPPPAGHMTDETDYVHNHSALAPSRRRRQYRFFEMLCKCLKFYFPTTDSGGRTVVMGSACRCTSFQVPFSRRKMLVQRRATTAASFPPMLAL
jgi:hypothetical protein